MPASSTWPPSRPAGPIKTLKRTFSSGGTVLTAGVKANSSSSATSKNDILAQLSASAYDFEMDDEDDDWAMSIDLTVASTSSTSANTSKSSTSTSYNTSASSTSSKIASSIASSSTSKSTSKTSATGISDKLCRSPPRAPQPFKLPTIPTNVESSKSALSRAMSKDAQMPAATQVVNIPSLPKVAPREARENVHAQHRPSKSEMAEEKMSAGSLRVPFTNKAKKDPNQTKLSGFFAPGSEKDNKRSCPWDDVGAPSSKSARGSSVPPVDGASIKCKGKGTGTGPLNVKQQIVLSAEQQKVLKMVIESRQSVFFTGSAGTGKSILLREIIASLRTKYATRGADRVAITASTGMAAANIGGTTIHSFSGIGLGQGTGEQLIDTVKKNRKALGRWLRTEVLIVDEISMLDGDLFDKLEHIARRFRKKPDKPFGGIQLIMTGDFFQLPPVTKVGPVKFAFEAKMWTECIQSTVNLTKVFRQKDTEFIDMLNEMRFGALSQASIIKFGKLKRVPKYTDGIEPTELFPLREQVDAANRQRLAALVGDEVIYHAIDDGEEKSPERLRKALDNVMAPQTLVLKLGAQVMLLKNMDNGLVNGSVGKVIAFKAKSEMIDEDDLDYVDAEEEKALKKTKDKWKREYSREPSAAPSAKEEDDGDDTKPVRKANLNEEKHPVVEWKLPGGGTLKMRMMREEFKLEDMGQVKARRKQFPMICAWAMSIHKSQGQTLERVKCDLGRIFEKGQAYVALSRATSLEGLQVLNFNDKKVLAHPKVVQWTKTLTTLT